MNRQGKYEAVAIGASAGGMKVIKELLMALPGDFSLPIMIVQHIADTADGTWADILNERCNVLVKEADEKEAIKSGTVYLAPANYHLLAEPTRILTLTVDERVNCARPSIDVLFETAAEAYREHLIGIILTGGNADGARGLLYIKEKGGLTIVQDPQTAEVPNMPQSAIRMGLPDHILVPEAIIELLLNIHTNQTERDELKN